MSRQDRIPASDLAVIITYTRGLSLRRCASRFGRSIPVIRAILGRYGVARRPPGRPRLVVPAEQLIAAYVDQGLSVGECVERFGISREIVRRTLDSGGVARDRRRRRRRIRIDEQALITAYRDRLLTIAQCAQQFGIGPKAVVHVLARHDVPRRAAGRPRLNPAVQAALISAYRDRQLTIAQCAEEFATSPSTVRRILRRNDIPARPPGRRSPRGLPEQAIVSAYRDERLSVRQCAARFTASTKTIIRVLEQAGVPRRPSGRSSPTVDDEQLIAAYVNQGLSVRQCAQRFRISPGAVLRALDRGGVERTRGRRPRSRPPH